MPSTAEIEKILPFLPGYRTPKSSASYHKRHKLDVREGLRVVLDSPEYIRETLFKKEANSAGLVIPSTIADPTDPNYEKQTLRFYAYFYDNDHEKLRKVQIYIYLVDETIQIYEPRIVNSGFPQGRLLARQKVLKQGSSDRIGSLDLNVGSISVIQGREYTIIGCDKFTREYLQNHGIHVPPNSDYPKEKEELAMTTNDIAPIPKFSHLDHRESNKKYLENADKVLRFYGLWDDTSKFGDLNKMTVLYFLCNDTTEVRKLKSNGHGEAFVRRHRMPKKLISFYMDGSNLSPNAMDPHEFYSENDFDIGLTITIYGREIFLYDADQFTKEYFASKGKSLGPAVPILNAAHVKNGIVQYTDGTNSQRSMTIFKGVQISNGVETDKTEFSIKYYRNDNTVEIFNDSNSSVFTRGKLSKPSSADYYTQSDFQVGNSICIETKGLNFKIVKIHQ